MSVLVLLLFALGLVLLVAGAELLVRGASRLAAAVGISPLVIGLTIVAFGTSTPELAVSVQSALAGQADLAVGNVVGSNIFNVLFILGLSALIVPLVVAQQIVRQEVPILIVVSAIFLVMALDGSISRLDGLLLFAGSLVYTVYLIRQSRSESAEVHAEYAQEFGEEPGPPQGPGLALSAGAIVGGLVLLVLGSRWLVDGAVAIARTLGVSELVIGLTIVAAGTSLPEVATSVLAAMRGERDIAVGNVIGSNISNLLVILGLSSVIAPLGLPVASSMLAFDLPVMLLVAVACLPIFAIGHIITRWEGGVFLVYYVAYTVYLVLEAIQPAALLTFNTTMVVFVVPLTLLTLVIVAVRILRQPARGSST